MQPWARRGVQAALVTGGMLAVGTGVASDLEGSESRGAQPPRVPHADDDAVSFGGFEGPSPQAGRDPSTTQPIFERLAGIVDPLRDVLADIGQAGEIPGRHRLAPPAPARMELAGWVMDTAQPGICDHPGAAAQSPDGDVPFGTPSEGFHRSLSWTGAVTAVSGDDRVPLDRALVVPTDDPATFASFDEPDSIVELWEGVVGNGTPVDLVVPEAIDLTVARIAEPPSEVYTVPRDVVDSALSTVFAPAPAPREFIPLTVPGEFQEQANEVPKLSDLVDLAQWESALHRAAPGDSTVPLFEGMPAGSAAGSRITVALEGSPMSSPPPNPLTSTAPLPPLMRA